MSESITSIYIFGSCKVSCIHCATPAEPFLSAGLPHEFVKKVFLFRLFHVGKVCQISLQLMIICVLSVGVAYIMPYARTCHLQYLCICFLVALHNVSKLTHMILALWFLESHEFVLSVNILSMHVKYILTSSLKCCMIETVV